MWYIEKGKKPDWTQAIAHLRLDPEMVEVIDKVGPCKLEPRRDYFRLLCLAIFNQQIAMKTAETLFGRFCLQFPRKQPTPPRVIAFIDSADEATLRHCGLSRQKRVYLRDLATHFVDGKLPVRQFNRMSDEAIAEALKSVKGIGQWTAEMFLMFNLNRPDVLPVDDLGLRKAFQRVFGWKIHPTAQRMTRRAETWRPWRTIAT